MSCPLKSSQIVQGQSLTNLVCSFCRIRRQEIENFMEPSPPQGKIIYTRLLAKWYDKCPRKTLLNRRTSFISLFCRMPYFIQLRYNHSMRHTCCRVPQYPINIRFFSQYLKVCTGYLDSSRYAILILMVKQNYYYH